MPAGQNFTLIRDFFDALSGKPKPASLVHHYVAEKDAALRHFILHYDTAFPHFELIVQDVFAFGGCVLAHLLMRGTHDGALWHLPPANLRTGPPLRPTHTGEFAGLGPTGRVITLPIMALFQVCRDQIVEHRLCYDAKDLLQQLGILDRPSKLSEQQCGHRATWRKITPVRHE